MGLREEVMRPYHIASNAIADYRSAFRAASEAFLDDLGGARIAREHAEWHYSQEDNLSGSRDKIGGSHMALLTTIRDLADDVLERIEARWDRAMDMMHGRPIRDPYLEDPRQLPQPPGQLPPPPQGVEHAPTAEELALNDEYEQAMWPDIEEEPEPDYGFEMIYESEWTVPEPGVETQLLLAQSNDGYHYAVYTSVRGGDPGDPRWSKAYPTREMADDAGSSRLTEIHYPELASDEPTDPRARVDRLLDDMPSSMHYYYDLEERDGGYAVVKCWQMMDENLAERGIQNAEQQVAWAPDLNELHDKIVQRFFPDRVQAQSHSVTEVRARDWWEDQRAQILESPLSVVRREERLESLGPEPADDAKVWLDGQGQRVEQPSVELQPIEIERPATEERADRDEHALGLEREEERSQEAAELEL